MYGLGDYMVAPDLRESPNLASFHFNSRRRTEELEPYECWTCPYGCGKVYRKSSSRSIRSHPQACPKTTAQQKEESKAKDLERQDAEHWTCPYKCGQLYLTTSRSSIKKHLASCNCRPERMRFSPAMPGPDRCLAAVASRLAARAMPASEKDWMGFRGSLNLPEVLGSSKLPAFTGDGDFSCGGMDKDVSERAMKVNKRKLEKLQEVDAAATANYTNSSEALGFNSNEADDREASVEPESSTEATADPDPDPAPLKKRRKPSTLKECEKWYCVYGCDKFYHKTSTRSISKHVRSCSLRTRDLMQRFLLSKSPDLHNRSFELSTPDFTAPGMLSRRIPALCGINSPRPGVAVGGMGLHQRGLHSPLMPTHGMGLSNAGSPMTSPFIQQRSVRQMGLAAGMDGMDGINSPYINARDSVARVEALQREQRMLKVRELQMQISLLRNIMVQEQGGQYMGPSFGGNDGHSPVFHPGSRLGSPSTPLPVPTESLAGIASSCPRDGVVGDVFGDVDL